MDQLSALNAFVKTVDLGSFVAAGRMLEISASAVGKSVARLEQHLGVRLLHRSTRRIQLTEEGRLFHERCRRILDDLDDAQAIMSQSVATPRGRLRVSAPIISYHFLMPLIPDFLARYPQVELEVDFNDQLVDLIGEGIDVVIRSGELSDSGLVSRPLQPYRFMLCASPDYLARHGTPMRPRDLDRHAAIRFRYPTSGKLLEWPLSLPDGEPEPRPRAACVFNNMEALLAATVSGLGIACMPDFLVRASLAEARVVAVLNDSMGVGGRFNALWPSSRQLSPKVRAFVDHMDARLAGRNEGHAPGRI